MLLVFSKEVKHNIKMGGVKCLSQRTAAQD